MKELRFLLGQIGMCLLTAFLFFQTWRSLVFLAPVMMIRLYRERNVLRNRRSRRLEEQFRDGLQCLLASLEAGYSVENSIAHAAEDLTRMLGTREPITEEFLRMTRKMQSGSTAEEAFEVFGERSGVADIRNFAGIFTMAKRTGGDVVKVVRAVTDTLYEKQEVYREIQTVLLAKQFEVGIMKAMPYLMLGYFLFFSPGFLAPLYAGFAGHLVMFVLYLCYRGCCIAAERMALIEI
jgi:tight adherence protein B